MFLRNYYNLMCRYNLNFTKNVSSSGYGNGSLKMRNVNGSYINNFSPSRIEYSFVPLTDLNINIGRLDPGIVFGTGNEPVTFDDYKMGTLITSGLTTSKVSISDITYDSVLNKFNCSSKYTLSNATAGEIIIREYGIQFLHFDNEYTGFLIFRDLLEPYALQPSESVNVILNASYTMPTIDESGNVVAGTQAYGLAIE